MEQHSEYDRRFYTPSDGGAHESAHRMLADLRRVVPFDSMVDFGCGIGRWLATARALGANDLLGIEGDWLIEDLIVDPAIPILRRDLEAPVALDRRFDLAISLEVAEHLSPARARSFVADICRAADVVLFGAAIPHQGGAHHVNEQWQSYWARLFAENDYLTFDFLRDSAWPAEVIRLWYKQNTLLYVQRQRYLALADRFPAGPVEDLASLDRVHPELYLKTYNEKMHPSTRRKLQFAKSLPGLLIQAGWRRIRPGRPAPPRARS